MATRYTKPKSWTAEQWSSFDPRDEQQLQAYRSANSYAGTFAPGETQFQDEQQKEQFDQANTQFKNLTQQLGATQPSQQTSGQQVQQEEKKQAGMQGMPGTQSTQRAPQTTPQENEGWATTGHTQPQPQQPVQQPQQTQPQVQTQQQPQPAATTGNFQQAEWFQAVPPQYQKLLTQLAGQGGTQPQQPRQPAPQPTQPTRSPAATPQPQPERGGSAQPSTPRQPAGTTQQATTTAQPEPQPEPQPQPTPDREQITQQVNTVRNRLNQALASGRISRDQFNQAEDRIRQRLGQLGVSPDEIQTTAQPEPQPEPQEAETGPSPVERAEQQYEQQMETLRSQGTEIINEINQKVPSLRLGGIDPSNPAGLKNAASKLRAAGPAIMSQYPELADKVSQISNLSQQMETAQKNLNQAQSRAVGRAQQESRAAVNQRRAEEARQAEQRRNQAQQYQNMIGELMGRRSEQIQQAQNAARRQQQQQWRQQMEDKFAADQAARPEAYRNLMEQRAQDTMDKIQSSARRTQERQMRQQAERLISEQLQGVSDEIARRQRAQQLALQARNMMQSARSRAEKQRAEAQYAAAQRQLRNIAAAGRRTHAPRGGDFVNTDADLANLVGTVGDVAGMFIPGAGAVTDLAGSFMGGDTGDIAGNVIGTGADLLGIPGGRQFGNLIGSLF